jgi:hypothetical protein
LRRTSYFIGAHETPVDKNGKKNRFTLIRSQEKYPYLTIQEEVSANTDSTVQEKVRVSSVFVSNHLLVSLKSGQSAKAFQKRLDQLGMTISEILPASEKLVVSWVPLRDPTAVFKAQKVLSAERAVASATKNLLIQGVDPRF